MPLQWFTLEIAKHHITSSYVVQWWILYLLFHWIYNGAEALCNGLSSCSMWKVLRHDLYTSSQQRLIWELSNTINHPPNTLCMQVTMNYLLQVSNQRCNKQDRTSQIRKLKWYTIYTRLEVANSRYKSVLQGSDSLLLLVGKTIECCTNLMDCYTSSFSRYPSTDLVCFAFICQCCICT